MTAIARDTRRAPAAKRLRTPTVLQMEAAECGAAVLGIILAYYGRWVPLEELRVACGVSRDGSKASNIVKAAQRYGLLGKGYRKEPAELRSLFDQAFTGVALVFEPGKDFTKGGERRNLIAALARRLTGSRIAVLYVVLTGLALLGIGLVIPIFSRIFVDQILISRQDWIGPLLIGMGLTALLRAAFTWLQEYFLLRLETRLAISTSSKFLWHILSLPTEFFAQRYAGDISSRVAINDNVAWLLSGELATTLLNLLLIVFYVILWLALPSRC